MVLGIGLKGAQLVVDSGHNSLCKTKCLTVFLGTQDLNQLEVMSMALLHKVRTSLSYPLSSSLGAIQVHHLGCRQQGPVEA